MKRLSPTALFLIIVVVVMAVFFVTSLGYANIRVKLMPLYMSGASIALALIALIQDMRSGARASMPTDEEGDVIEDAAKLGTPLSAYFKAFGWFAVLIAAIYLFGFVVGILLWIPAYMWRQGIRLWKGVVTAVVTVGVFYGVFTMALQVPLYGGKLFEWIGWRF